MYRIMQLNEVTSIPQASLKKHFTKYENVLNELLALHATTKNKQPKQQNGSMQT